MTSFFWSQGHIGWPLFGLLVFTAAWLLVTDVLWRTASTRVRIFAPVAGLAWIIGMVIILVIARA